MFPIVSLNFGDAFASLLFSLWQSVKTSESICSVGGTTTIYSFSPIFNVNAPFRYYSDVMCIPCTLRSQRS